MLWPCVCLCLTQVGVLLKHDTSAGYSRVVISSAQVSGRQRRFPPLRVTAAARRRLAHLSLLSEFCVWPQVSVERLSSYKPMVPHSAHINLKVRTAFWNRNRIFSNEIAENKTTSTSTSTWKWYLSTDQVPVQVPSTTTLQTTSPIRYDTIRYEMLFSILTCARKPTWVGLIYRTETTTKNCKTEKLKSKIRYVRSNSRPKKSGESCSQFWSGATYQLDSPYWCYCLKYTRSND